ncbi:Outer membrane protein TolC [Pedobacter westerhofensis]|uniref:Outer membrane protein TolC n=1 Tax=Pedobacter westerhofensis TaxID=425512 RepID=A0A521DW63_9SPHI|nr:TolC family protein [Pedobacter westerhofensis]SMO75984.1 Outer membrane protein TolC [Pedobacter westerhofensis]
MIHRTIKLSCFALLLPGILYAQNVKKLTIQEAIQLGVENSKNLKLSQNRIEQNMAQLDIVKDNALPSASASAIYNHAEIPTNQLTIGGADPINLPKRADAYIGLASVSQLVYGGGKLKYARESTKLLADVARLDADKVKEEVTFAAIDTYYALYKLSQSHQVVDQNLESIASQLKQAERFFEQGIVTKNDVLRFQLQQSNVTLTKLEIEGNQRIVNYNLDVLLGLPEDTQIEIADPAGDAMAMEPLANYLDRGMTTRQELKELDLRNKAADFDIKSVKANTLPTFSLGADVYYINPSGNFIPSNHEYIVPMTVGATLSWNIGNLWTNKNKVSKARIQQDEFVIQKTIQSDNVRTEINKNYQNYQVAKNKINVLETSIAQATENDRLYASRYKNNVASVTDRIDAETLLFQAKINLEIAKADAGIAYYTLLKSTGKISQ